MYVSYHLSILSSTAVCSGACSGRRKVDKTKTKTNVCFRRLIFHTSYRYCRFLIFTVYDLHSSYARGVCAGGFGKLRRHGFLHRVAFCCCLVLLRPDGMRFVFWLGVCRVFRSIYSTKKPARMIRFEAFSPRLFACLFSNIREAGKFRWCSCCRCLWCW